MEGSVTGGAAADTSRCGLFGPWGLGADGTRVVERSGAIKDGRRVELAPLCCERGELGEDGVDLYMHFCDMDLHFLQPAFSPLHLSWVD